MIAVLPQPFDDRITQIASRDRLVIPSDLDRDLRGRATKGYPHEVCGLLLGRHVGGSWRVEAITQGENLVQDRRHDRFELDPGHYVRADRIAAEAGLDIIGVWHTHPDHPSVPSSTDRQHAWEGFLYLILTTRRQGAEKPRAWVFDGQRFSEIRKEVTDE